MKNKNPLKNTEPIKKKKSQIKGYLDTEWGIMRVYGEDRKYYGGEISGGFHNRMGLSVLKKGKKLRRKRTY